MPLPIDAYSPEEIANTVKEIGIKKANLAPLPLAVLGILAGAFVSFGAMLYTVAITDSQLGFGPTRLLGGMAFSLGLVLVVIAGAELFTGNNLVVMAWAERKISTRQLLRNWCYAYSANFLGAIASAYLVHLSGILTIGNNASMETAMAIAHNKVQLTYLAAFIRGILCNALVCLAIWLCLAAHSVTGKILAIVFPITAFVALGFEHSIANMYLITIAMLQNNSDISMVDFWGNIIPVSLGNIIGGSVLVALVYWVCYLYTNE